MHYYQRLWIENLSPMTLSYFGDSSIFISVHGPAWILKPDRHLMAEWIANSRLRYKNSLMDHLIQPIDHEILGILYKKEKLKIIKNRDFYLLNQLLKMVIQVI